MQRGRRNKKSILRVVHLKGFSAVELSKEITAVEWHQAVTGPLGCKKSNLPKLLVNLLFRLWGGKARVARTGDIDLDLIRGFSTVIVCGGAAESSEFWDVINSFDMPFEVLKPAQPIFAGLEGGMTIAKRLSLKTPLILDWGQTTVKRWFKGNKQILSRDLDQFPIRVTQTTEDLAVERCKWKNWYNSLLASSLNECDGIVVALPLRFNEAGVATGCSYTGLDGDLSELLDNRSNIPTYVLNDTDSAGAGVISLCRGKSLIVTSGTRVSGCLWQPKGESTGFSID